MRKPLLKVFIIFSLILLALTACDHNVYLAEPDKVAPSLWKVNDIYFDTLQEAMDYIYGTTKGIVNSKAIDDVGVTRRAILQRNVMNGERGGGLIVPADFKGQLVIDFNGFTYEFDDSLDHFFDVRGGDEVYIINGTTVIYNEASHVPFAIAVNTDTLTIDEHLIDDRRWDPTNNISDAKLFDVGEKGKLRVVGIQETDATRLTGVVSVFTDGTSGGKLILEESRVVITNILTRYKNPETGAISDSITLTTIPADARSEITISSGYVTINNIETLSDYYKKEGTAPAELYSKAILNIFSDDATNLTKIENPHDSTEKPIDTAIQTIIDDQNTITDPDVDHVIIHSFDDEHTHAAVDPTCTTDGNIYYVQCTYCNHYFDKNNNQLSDDLSLDTDHNGPVIPALGHISPLEHIDAVAATCTKTGNIEYWHCTRCGSYFSDEAGTTEITYESTILPIDASNHNIEEVEAVAPTCTEAGNIHYWHCTRCNKCFSDSEGTTEISQASTVVPATGHTPGEWEFDDDYHWRNCSVCGEELVHEEHHWPDEPVPCSDGNHLVFICTDCGAEKNASEPVYLLYNIGIAEVRLRAIEATPCGDFYINGTKMESDSNVDITDSSVTIEYRPHINSNINYTPYCYVSTQYGQTIINGTKNEDGSYIATFSVTSTRPHTVVLQNRTEGGNLSFVCYLNLK